MLALADNNEVLSPTKLNCKYTLHKHTARHCIVMDAMVGEQIYHKWSCNYPDLRMSPSSLLYSKRFLLEFTDLINMSEYRHSKKERKNLFKKLFKKSFFGIVADQNATAF